MSAAMVEESRSCIICGDPAAEDVAAATGWTVDEARDELAGAEGVERDGIWWRAA